jgi:uncharacterized protein YjiS (DUF1127 family)
MTISEREERDMLLLTSFIAVSRAWADWRRRRGYAELMVLDDRLLADIGLRRADIPAIFHQKARPEGVDKGAAMVLSTLQARLVFGHRGLPPIWPQL